MITAMVKNTPDNVKSGWMVARRDECTAELWYYATYDEKKRAYDVALELENGIVLEVK